MPVRPWWGRVHVRQTPRAPDVRAAAAIVVALAGTGIADRARAQWNGEVAVTSDERWRGRSLSAGRPAATLSLGYDDRSGAYLDGAATVAALRDGPDLVSYGIDAGYARRLNNGLVLDLGLTRREFRGAGSGASGSGYTELYVGASGRSLAARVLYSPDYLRSGVHTVYGTLDGVVRPLSGWRLLGHAGLMTVVRQRPWGGMTGTQFDYSLGVARQIGKIDARLAWSGGLPGKDYYGNRARSRQAVTVSASIGF